MGSLLSWVSASDIFLPLFQIFKNFHEASLVYNAVLISAVQQSDSVIDRYDFSYSVPLYWRRERLPSPVVWPGEFHGLCSPWGSKESDLTE